MQLDPVLVVIGSIILAAAGLGAGWLLHGRLGAGRISLAEERAREITNEAKKDAENLKKERIAEVKEEFNRKKQDFEKDSSQKRNKLQSFEKQLASREENLGRKLDPAKPRPL